MKCYHDLVSELAQKGHLGKPYSDATGFKFIKGEHVYYIETNENRKGFGHLVREWRDSFGRVTARDYASVISDQANDIRVTWTFLD